MKQLGLFDDDAELLTAKSESFERLNTEVDFLKEKEQHLRNQFSTMLAGEIHFDKDFTPETFPRFSKEMAERSTQNTDTVNVLFSTPSFEYTDPRFECYSCEYHSPAMLSNNVIYYGQWKNNQKFGRGIEIINEGEKIK